MILARLLRIVVLAPYLAAGFIPALSPTRALIAAWFLEAGFREREEHGGRLAYALLHGAPWLLLHGLRSDASAIYGLLLIVGLALTHEHWRRTERQKPLALIIAALFLLPAVASFLIELDQRSPPDWLRASDVWQWGTESESSIAGSLPPLPVGEYSTIPFKLPDRLWPKALEGAPAAERAHLALYFIWAWAAVALVMPTLRRRTVLLVGAMAAAGIGVVMLAGPKAMVVFYETEAEVWTVEAYATGGDLWRPNEANLLPPSGAARESFLVRQADKGGGYRVVSPAPWGVVRPGAASSEPDEPAAWLEVHPLRAEQSGGPAAQDGGIEVLRLWAAGDSDPGGARWMLGENGTLHRVPLGP